MKKIWPPGPRMWLIGSATLLVAAVALAIGGCRAFYDVVLPPHPNSEDTEEERVSIEMLDWKGLAPYHADWRKAFPRREPKEIFESPKEGDLGPAPLFAAGAGMLTGLALDVLKRELEKEASRYETQFSARKLEDGFWFFNGQEWKPTVAGFRLTRTTRAHSCPPAFTLVCGFAPSFDGSMFLLAPLHFELHSSRAKVQTMRWWSYCIPLFWWHCLLEAHGEVATRVQVEIDSISAGASKDLVVETAGVADFELPSVRLGGANVFSVSAAGQHDASGQDTEHARRGSATPARGKEPLNVGVVGFLTGVRRPPGLETAARSGVFRVRARVTEKDTSNSRRYLDRSADRISGEREKIIERVVETIGGYRNGSDAESTTSSPPKHKRSQSAEPEVLKAKEDR